ncbi:recombinase family protein [Rothia sp. AR01]|uniref:Recombinase family protein n=1 Tax=Rothia santali TaxID=2949643 RepID=A0A9X2HBH2_9MICC|nr:recombinase family protein [Rothia santali]MCP3425160.1 recombinase family protein [Rothia santali]
MRIGYARGSIRDQREALEALGCAKVFTDVASSTRASRPGLELAKSHVRDGDVLVVTRVDRLGRTAYDTLKTIKELDESGVRVEAQKKNLDTGTPAGRLVVTAMAGLTEWERDILRERTREGLAHARATGRAGGRPPALTGPARDAALAQLAGGMSASQVAAFHGVSKWMIQRLQRSAATERVDQGLTSEDDRLITVIKVMLPM